MTDQLAVVENKQQHPLVVLRERLEARKSELRAALVDVTPEQFIRALTTSAQINPELQACSWPSLWMACMQACRDGLLPDGVEGAIVPFKSRATWIPMYQGLLRRFRRSGQFKSVAADVVRQGDEFSYFIDEDGPHLRHVPGDNFDAPIEKIYAAATTKDGGKFVTVMTVAEANKHRNVSRAQREDAPWKLWPEEMYKKTVLRRLSKYLPNARDILPDEDAPDEPAPQLEPMQIMPPGARKPGAAAALDQFGASPDTVGLPSDTAGDAEQGPSDQPADRTLDDAAGDVARAPATVRDAGDWPDPGVPGGGTPKTIHDDLHARSIDAYKRGQKAKSEGLTRKAIPPEYRDSKRTREALCWQAGFDGGPMPEFNSEGKVLVP